MAIDRNDDAESFECTSQELYLRHEGRTQSNPRMSKISSTDQARAKILLQLDEAYISHYINALAASFDKVPCTVAFATEAGITIWDHVNKSVRDSIQNSGGALIVSGHGSVVSLWQLPYPMSPDLQERPLKLGPIEAEVQFPVFPPTQQTWSIKQEWLSAIERAKCEWIGTRVDNKGKVKLLPHYNLDFIGRNPNFPKVSNDVSSVIMPILELAEQRQMKVWLESATEELIPLYQRYGFKVVQKIVVGVGKVNSTGWPTENGEGVSGWFMIINNT